MSLSCQFLALGCTSFLSPNVTQRVLLRHCYFDNPKTRKVRLGLFFGSVVDPGVGVGQGVGKDLHAGMGVTAREVVHTGKGGCPAQLQQAAKWNR